jgi:hypothetical protein
LRCAEIQNFLKNVSRSQEIYLSFLSRRQKGTPLLWNTFELYILLERSRNIDNFFSSYWNICFFIYFFLPLFSVNCSTYFTTEAKQNGNGDRCKGVKLLEVPLHHSGEHLI